MTKKTVLITGASGFVGCRLAERLTLGTKYNVIAMVRRFSGPGVARLGRLPINMISADVLDLPSLIQAFKEADIVIHLAYGARGTKKEKKNITVSGTENVMKAALKTNVQKVIYVSTAVVHGQNPKLPIVEESAPFVESPDVYRASKMEAENIVWKYHKEHDLSVVVFRPPLLYGPFGRDWSVRIVQEIKRGAVLPNGGDGAANLLYIDNFVDAFMHAMENDAGDGEAFFVVDDERLTWKDVYQRYADMVDEHPPFRDMSANDILTRIKSAEPSLISMWFIAPLRVCLKIIKNSLQSDDIRSEIRSIPWIKMLVEFVPQHIKDLVKGNDKKQRERPDRSKEANVKKLPNKDMVELYSSKSRFSNDKLKKVYGYKQRVTFDEAMQLIHSWLQHQRLIP